MNEREKYQQEKREQEAIKQVLEGLKDVVGPANELLEAVLGPQGAKDVQKVTSAALFSRRFDKWKEDFEKFRVAHNKQLASGKVLLPTLDQYLEVSDDMPLKDRDALVALRSSLETFTDNEPLKSDEELDAEEKKEGGTKRRDEG